MVRPRVAAFLVACVAWLAPGGPGVVVARAEPVEEVGPDLYYLQDDAGRLVPVPGFRYRDFVDLLRLKDGLPGLPEPPAAVLETISVVGTLPSRDPARDATERACDAVVELTIRQTRPGWASLPLDLQGLLVARPPRHDGPGRVVLTADSAGRNADGEADRRPAGYRLWLEAPPATGDARHTVTIEGRLPVESSASHETVALVMPPATASRVELRTARSEPSVAVRPATLPPQVLAADDADATATGSRVVVVGGVGPLQIRIGDRDGPAETATAVPETSVESLVTIDGKTAVIDAVVTLDHLSAKDDTITLRLPAKSTLRAVSPPATLVSRSGTPEAPAAVIRVDRDADGLATVELACEQAVDSSGAKAFESLGFAVAGVPEWRQRGRVSLLVDGDWQVEWGDGGATRRIDPPLLARRPGFVAAFAYDAQPASLPLRVRPRGSRTVIEPEYRYAVAAARVTLDARLRVAVSGAAVSRLAVDIDGWQVEEVGPAGTVDAAGVAVQGKRVVIPFMQGLSGEATVEIRCTRPLDRAAERVEWKLPTPEAGLVGPATVLVIADSDIELIPDATAMRGLVRQVASAQARPDADRPVLAYRLDGADGRFAAQRRFLPRRVDATVESRVRLDESTSVVTQTMKLTVAHVPLEYVDFLVPSSIQRGETLEIRQGGQRLNPLADVDGSPPVDTDGDAAAAAPATTRVRALLPVPLLGSGELTVTYEVPTPSVPPETTVAEDLPLVMPLEVRVGRQSLQIEAAETLAVEVRGEAWKRDAAPQGATAGRSWTSPRFQDVVPLALAAKREETTSETVIEAAWLQTRLLGEQREDVFRFAIGTAAERLSFVLPESMLGRETGASGAAQVEVRVDGTLVEDAVRSDGRVALELPPSRGRRGVLVELRGTRPQSAGTRTPFGSLPGLSRVALEPPQFPEGMQQRRFYWELSTDPAEHVLAAPGRWTAQQRWSWGRFGLERVPVVSRDALDAWVLGNAGRPRDVEPAIDALAVGGRSVYSGVGPPGNEALWLVPTWLLVLIASGPVLAWGLTLVYWRPARSVAGVVGVAAIATLAATLAPSLVPLAVQAALPGVALAVVAAWMRVSISRPSAARSRVMPPASGSVTQFAPQPSIIVAPSVAGAVESVTSPGRSAS